eukprot:scaffold1298_cov257-Pinguiococcus_pyrenoidosus.AAC.11
MLCVYRYTFDAACVPLSMLRAARKGLVHCAFCVLGPVADQVLHRRSRGHGAGSAAPSPGYSGAFAVMRTSSVMTIDRRGGHGRSKEGVVAAFLAGMLTAWGLLRLAAPAAESSAPLPARIEREGDFVLLVFMDFQSEEDVQHAIRLSTLEMEHVKENEPNTLSYEICTWQPRKQKELLALAADELDVLSRHFGR